MPDPQRDPNELSADELGHPKGTLAILALYALLFALGWIALYWCEFLPRGAPHP